MGRMATKTVDLPRQQGRPGSEHEDEPVATPRTLAWLLAFTGAAGVLASWVITLDKFLLLEDPDFKPACSLNPVVSCGSVMKSDQAAAFGFPNPCSGWSRSESSCASARACSPARATAAGSGWD